MKFQMTKRTKSLHFKSTNNCILDLLKWNRLLFIDDSLLFKDAVEMVKILFKHWNAVHLEINNIFKTMLLALHLHEQYAVYFDSLNVWLCIPASETNGLLQL